MLERDLVFASRPPEDELLEVLAAARGELALPCFGPDGANRPED